MLIDRVIFLSYHSVFVKLRVAMQVEQKQLDRLAIGLSALCALHCLMTPLIILFVPFLSFMFFDDKFFHLYLLFLIVPTSLFAFYIGFKGHKDTTVFLYGTLGLMVLLFAALFGHQYAGESSEKVITLFGSLISSFAHFRNFKLCRDEKFFCHLNEHQH